MAGQIVWFEVMGKDAKASQAFYGKLFGWQYATSEAMPDYGVVRDVDGVPGGVGGSPQGGWSCFYVSVDDLDGSVEQAVGLGAQVRLPPMQIPNGDRIAVVSDPDGLAIGLVQVAATA
ncbi:MAG: VOC family protein [Alphaproteobacteria bacterium]|nr:VOC family protein [Alphaproteobacteria bacterium]